MKPKNSIVPAGCAVNRSLQTIKGTRFIVIRHGETEWNVLGREMGQLDSPLTADGVTGAMRLGRRLARTRFDALYSSDLGRAARTAELIAAQCVCPVSFDERLRERDMGIFQGLTEAERSEQYPAECANYRRLGSSYEIPDGESADQCVARAVECFEELAQRHAGGTIVTVTHGGVLMGFFEYVLGLPFRSGGRFRRPNVAWNLFTREADRWVLETWGDLSHLQPDEDEATPNDPIEPLPARAPE